MIHVTCDQCGKSIEDSKNPVLSSQPIIFRTDKNSKKYVAGDKERVEEFHALPVVSDTDESSLIGIVTTTDVIQYMLEQY